MVCTVRDVADGMNFRGSFLTALVVESSFRPPLASLDSYDRPVRGSEYTSPNLSAHKIVESSGVKTTAQGLLGIVLVEISIPLAKTMQV